MPAPGKPVNTTVPFAGWVTDAIVTGSPSPSLSLASTASGVGAESSGTIAASSTATATSATHVTVTDTVPVEPPLSAYVNVSGAPPAWLLQ